MCRFLAYKGRDIPLAELISRTDRSLIRQSFKAREREEPLNGDGFGLGWYEAEMDPVPGVFTSVTPAWSNRNLARLAEKIASTCVFAHVRAASPGTLVSEINCHPFQHDRFLWMHNGLIADFARIRRRLRDSLEDEAYEVIQGTTDSEHAFALFLDLLRDELDSYSTDTLRARLLETIARIEAWSEEAEVRDPSTYNLALTDGQSIVVTRFAARSDAPAPSLYYAVGEAFDVVDGVHRMLPAQRQPRAIVIASEPLTDVREDWTTVPDGHVLTVTPELHVRLDPIALTRPAR